MAHRPANEQWEYKFEHKEESSNVFTNDDLARVIAERTIWLNEFGADGWELVKVHYASNVMAVVLKRRRGF